MRRPPAFPPPATRKRRALVEPEPQEAPAEAEVAAPAPEPEAEPSGVSTRLRERLEELKGAKKRARRKKLGYIAGAVVGTGLLAWLVAFSPVFALQIADVEVAGTNEYVSEGEVIAVVEKFDGIPLARLDTSQLADELKEIHAVKDASFTRVWPSGIRVTLEARSAVAATPAESGYTILDGDGVRLGSSEEEVEGLPIVDVNKDTEDLGATIDAVLAVMESLPPPLLEQVVTVGAKGPDEVEFTLDGGSRVVWGSAEESELKVAVLEVLLQVPAEVYNVVAPLSPITS